MNPRILLTEGVPRCMARELCSLNFKWLYEEMIATRILHFHL